MIDLELFWKWVVKKMKWGFDFDLPKLFHVSANPEVLKNITLNEN